MSKVYLNLFQPSAHTASNSAPSSYRSRQQQESSTTTTTNSTSKSHLRTIGEVDNFNYILNEKSLLQNATSMLTKDRLDSIRSRFNLTRGRTPAPSHEPDEVKPLNAKIKLKLNIRDVSPLESLENFDPTDYDDLKQLQSQVHSSVLKQYDLIIKKKFQLPAKKRVELCEEANRLVEFEDETRAMPSFIMADKIDATINKQQVNAITNEQTDNLSRRGKLISFI
jgi:hypothetical protein